MSVCVSGCVCGWVGVWVVVGGCVCVCDCQSIMDLTRCMTVLAEQMAHWQAARAPRVAPAPPPAPPPLSFGMRTVAGARRLRVYRGGGETQRVVCPLHFPLSLGASGQEHRRALTARLTGSIEAAEAAQARKLAQPQRCPSDAGASPIEAAEAAQARNTTLLRKGGSDRGVPQMPGTHWRLGGRGFEPAGGLDAPNAPATRNLGRPLPAVDAHACKAQEEIRRLVAMALRVVAPVQGRQQAPPAHLESAEAGGVAGKSEPSCKPVVGRPRPVAPGEERDAAGAERDETEVSHADAGGADKAHHQGASDRPGRAAAVSFAGETEVSPRELSAVEVVGRMQAWVQVLEAVDQSSAGGGEQRAVVDADTRRALVQVSQM